jgi:hypothetical protein
LTPFRDLSGVLQKRWVDLAIRKQQAGEIGYAGCQSHENGRLDEKEIIHRISNVEAPIVEALFLRKGWLVFIRLSILGV